MKKLYRRGALPVEELYKRATPTVGETVPALFSPLLVSYTQHLIVRDLPTKGLRLAVAHQRDQRARPVKLSPTLYSNRPCPAQPVVLLQSREWSRQFAGYCSYAARAQAHIPNACIATGTARRTVNPIDTYRKTTCVIKNAPRYED